MQDIEMNGDCGDHLAEMIQRHEGFRNVAYQDSLGVWTIGWGHNLQKPLTRRACDLIFEDDLNDALRDCSHAFPWFFDLTVNRRHVLVDMCFNLGLTRLLLFKKMLAAIEAENWVEAAAEMERSLWADQVKGRATELATMMREG